ncbi:molybdopterin biosynthesis protein MoeB, partial [Rhizobium leguminosarum]|nr:molybdopterin biosynthesis protein MoeB [Rhizobium leguminosarum]
RLLMLDGLSMEWTAMRAHRDPACPVCRNGHPGHPTAVGEILPG